MCVCGVSQALCRRMCMMHLFSVRFVCVEKIIYKKIWIIYGKTQTRYLQPVEEWLQGGLRTMHSTKNRLAMIRQFEQRLYEALLLLK